MKFINQEVQEINEGMENITMDGSEWRLISDYAKNLPINISRIPKTNFNNHLLGQLFTVAIRICSLSASLKSTALPEAASLFLEDITEVCYFRVGIVF